MREITEVDDDDDDDYEDRVLTGKTHPKCGVDAL